MVIKNISKEKIIIENHLVRPNEQIMINDIKDISKYSNKIKIITDDRYNVISKKVFYKKPINKENDSKENINETKQEETNNIKKEKTLKINKINNVKENNIEENVVIENNDIINNDFNILKEKYINICKEKDLNDILLLINNSSNKEELLYIAINYILPIL